MNARAVRGIVAAAVLFALPVAVSAQERDANPIVVSDPVLVASVHRLASESPSWRDAIAAVAVTGRRAYLVSSDVIKGALEDDSLAQVHPLPDAQSHVDAVLIVVNLELLLKLSGLPAKAADFEDDLDRILAHEVYGHAVPFLLAGNMSGKCADPAAGQSAIASCAVQRENVIRREMRLGQRFDYGREGLALAHRNQR